MDKFYTLSLHAACALDTSVTGSHGELSDFLINLALSQRARHARQKIHYLHLALIHLDSFEKEIRISDVNEEILRLARIPEQIRSIKNLMQEYVRYLVAE
jgi:hypothetical protein